MAWNRADRTAVEDAIRGLVADPTKSYTISGRTWTGRDLSELRDLKAEIQNELAGSGAAAPTRRLFVTGQMVR